MSENSTVARICNTAPSECGAKSITLCLEDFKSLSEGAKQFDKLVNMKVAAALAQVGAVRASEIKTLRHTRGD
ncbi:hypothetical protein Bca52824_047282 [Brassica carinata]|uniref:Uncharacterized protein n=1 Tax=Brassica carinata TaxID=52824 RepID=A0A8X7RED4_BRACI|nr:hypothetical protein Bca52824_047282 [Brassica carinata]